MYLFDTDIISWTVKGSPPKNLIERLRKVPRELQFTSSINVSEIYYGASRTGRGSELIKAYEEHVFSRLTVLPFDLESGKIFGRLKATLEKRGLARSEPDLRIAAIALQNRLTVITGNVRHFSKIPGLPVENWLS